MSKIISFIIVIAVLVFIVTAVVNRSKKAEVQVKEIPKQTVVSTPAKGTIPGIKLTDGSYVQLHLDDGHYTLNPSDVSMNWTGRKTVLNNWADKGVISAKEASFDVKNGEVVSNSFIIDMNSIEPLTTGAGGGQDRLTTHLKSADFFDATVFPTSTFVAKELLASTTSIFILKGDLTLKGTTHEISIPVTLDRSDAKFIKAKGSVDLDRTLWNVKYGSGKFFDNLGNNLIDDLFNVSFEIKVSTSAVQEAKIETQAEAI